MAPVFRPRVASLFASVPGHVYRRLLPTALLLACAAGCGGGGGDETTLHPVSVTVTRDGLPAVGAVVVLEPGADAGKGRRPSGTVGA
ncbi:MAG: hypothetical protein AAF907_16795, partial [Planctomycetota bacterium]